MLSPSQDQKEGVHGLGAHIGTAGVGLHDVWRDAHLVPVIPGLAAVC